MKPEWGIKRTCQDCGTKFYDMRKPEIVCPKCGAAFSAVVAKPRRAPKAEPKPVPAPKKAAPKKSADDSEIEDDDLELDDVDLDDDDEDDDEVIEDASDLGGDDDVSEVMENIDGEKEA